MILGHDSICFAGMIASACAGRVSYVTLATSSPDRKVSPPMAAMAKGMPSASASRPASNAPVP